MYLLNTCFSAPDSTFPVCVLVQQTLHKNVFCCLMKVNHACSDQANLELVYEAVGSMQGPRRLALVAKYNIETGEFLSWDYNVKFDDCQCLSVEHKKDDFTSVVSRVMSATK